MPLLIRVRGRKIWGIHQFGGSAVAAEMINKYCRRGHLLKQHTKLPRDS